MVDRNQAAEDSTADEEDSREDSGSSAGPARRGGAGGSKVKEAAAGCARCSGRVLVAAALVDVNVDERRYYHSSMLQV